jgi:hypothetical protein
MKISSEIVLLFKRVERIYRQREAFAQDENKNVISVEEMASHLSSLYEKLRNSVDFKEVHLLRRYAIERNLKRRFILEILKPQIARNLIEDLVRGQYIPNNGIPESKVQEVEQVIAKYNDLFARLNEHYENDKLEQKNLQDYFDWLIGIEACEIDIILTPEDIADAVIEAMYEVTKPRVKLKGDDLSIREKNIQLYITIHKSLVKSDVTIISYHLLNLYYPEWLQADQKLITEIATNIGPIYRTIQRHLRHPYQRRISQAIKEPVVTFQVLHELILRHEAKIEDLLVQPEELEVEARKLIIERYKSIRSKLSKSSLRAIIYIFITKVLFAVALEFPYERYILGHINMINLGINIVFPPLLMFLVTLSFSVPGTNNTDKILANLKDLVYGKSERSILCQLKSKYKQSLSYQIFYNFMYTLLYIAVFGGIIYVLHKLNFNIISGAIFLFFLTAVSFFAIRIRNTAKELKVIDNKEDALSFLMNFFSLPIVGVGRWLSTKFRKINLFAFVMDFIIEAPFKMIVLAFEDWLGFMKEKKEEVYHDDK